MLVSYEGSVAMVSDQEIAKGVEAVLRLRQSDPNTVTTLNAVVQQLEATLGLDLSHKTSFISHQISLLLSPPPSTDHLSPQYHPQVPSHFALPPHHHHLYRSADVLNFNNPPPPQPQLQRQQREANVLNAAANASEIPKESTPAGTKRRGGSGGLNKVCGVSPELQAIVGQPALPRTEIVKQLWAYIRKNNLQDPSNKRNIICDEALRIVFETDCTDMFNMNKLLAKHIIPLEPTKKSGQVKKLKVDVESATGSVESGPPLVIISEALANFFATGEKEMPQSEALRCVWEYIKVNRLEDPMNSMAIICDAKLRELFGCESISALGISEMLARHHLFKQC